MKNYNKHLSFLTNTGTHYTFKQVRHFQLIDLFKESAEMVLTQHFIKDHREALSTIMFEYEVSDQYKKWKYESSHLVSLRPFKILSILRRSCSIDTNTIKWRSPSLASRSSLSKCTPFYCNSSSISSTSSQIRRTSSKRRSLRDSSGIIYRINIVQMKLSRIDQAIFSRLPQQKKLGKAQLIRLQETLHLSCELGAQILYNNQIRGSLHWEWEYFWHPW